jgi:hypothetical protein
VPGYGAPARPQPTGPVNRFAIVSLVTGLIGLVPLGFIFGILAIRQINRTGERGRGHAVGGILTAGVWMYVIYMIVSVQAGLDGLKSVEDLVGRANAQQAQVSLYPGVCVDEVHGSSAAALTTVPCSTPHGAEVYSVFSLPSGRYPGVSSVRTDVEDRCEGDFERYRSGANADMQIDYLYPESASAWAFDRGVICFAVDPAGTRTTSLFD